MFEWFYSGPTKYQSQKLLKTLHDIERGVYFFYFFNYPGGLFFPLESAEDMKKYMQGVHYELCFPNLLQPIPWL